MTTTEKCEAILHRIMELVDADESQNVAVAFSRDWGPHSCTLEITGRGHTHCGSFHDGATWDQLIDDIHNALHGGPGLSFVRNPS